MPFRASKIFKLLVPDEDYSMNIPCALHLISEFLLFKHTYREVHMAIVVWYVTTSIYVTSADHYCCEINFYQWRSVLDTTSLDEIYHWLAISSWIPPATFHTPLITDTHDITEIDLKMELTTVVSVSTLLWFIRYIYYWI